VTIADRISRYIGKIPGAVSGNGGHSQTFKVAMVLFNGFGCSEAETLGWLRRYNSKCEPPWSEAELRATKPGRRPRRPMINPWLDAHQQEILARPAPGACVSGEIQPRCGPRMPRQFSTPDNTHG
jgi:hypothetical protein